MSQGLASPAALPGAMPAALSGHGLLLKPMPAQSSGHGTPSIGYFQRTTPVALILGAFVVFTLPLTWLALTNPDSSTLLKLELAYMLGLGVTHFVITPTIYLQSSNLRHFNSSWRNRLIYFAIPISIFVVFDLYRALEVAVLLPLFDVAFRLLIRAVDFQHFGRQSYGVLQLFKARAGAKFPAWQRRAEYWYAWATVAVLLVTYVRGGRLDTEVHPGLIAAHWLFAAVLAGLGLTILTGIVVTARLAERPGRLLAPATYFLLQTISALLAAYSTALYGIALAMHYVEYHVLMLPRCFNTQLDPRQWSDRLFSKLRSSRIVFYVLLLVAAFGVSMLTGVTTSMVNAMAAMLAGMWKGYGGGAGPASSYTALLAIFDGLFVFHYFVEMFVWRFSEPHYRQTLSPLYFARKKITPAVRFAARRSERAASSALARAARRNEQPGYLPS